MADFVTMWNKMISMPGKDRLEKIDAYLETLPPDEADQFLIMLQDPDYVTEYH